MGKQYKELTPENIEFIKEQKLFYLASCSGTEVNLSPKGFECIEVLNAHSLLYLDYPGSGNRTARDIKNDGEITLVFNAFSGAAQIVRLFCKGKLIEKHHDNFELLFQRFYNRDNTIDVNHIRQIIQFNIYAVESSCGMSVPKMQYQKERTGLKKWISNQHDEGILTDYINAHDEPVNLNTFRNSELS